MKSCRHFTFPCCPCYPQIFFALHALRTLTTFLQPLNNLKVHKKMRWRHSCAVQERQKYWKIFNFKFSLSRLFCEKSEKFLRLSILLAVEIYSMRKLLNIKQQKLKTFIITDLNFLQEWRKKYNRDWIKLLSLKKWSFWCRKFCGWFCQNWIVSLTVSRS